MELPIPMTAYESVSRMVPGLSFARFSHRISSREGGDARGYKAHEEEPAKTKLKYVEVDLSRATQ